MVRALQCIYAYVYVCYCIIFVTKLRCVVSLLRSTKSLACVSVVGGMALKTNEMAVKSKNVLIKVSPFIKSLLRVNRTVCSWSAPSQSDPKKNAFYLEIRALASYNGRYRWMIVCLINNPC